MNRFFTLLLLSIIIFSCNVERNDVWQEKSKSPERLHRAIKKVTDAIVHDIFSPPVAGRVYAYVTIAAYEASVPGDSSLLTMAGQLRGLETLPSPEKNKEYSFELASVEATLKVGRHLVFSEQMVDSFHDTLLIEYKRDGMPEDVFKRSIEFGDKIANHIIAWAETDNYKQSRSFPKYTIDTNPATWKPTPPAYMDAIEPHWNRIRPFVLDSANQFIPSPPTPYSVKKGSQFYNDALETYQTGVNLTQNQKEIAAFWDCNPFIMMVNGHVMFAKKLISPGGHWINIARTANEKLKLTVSQSAEAYMLVAISVSDGFISCWDEKYRSVLVRPETYINQNIDENWTPLLQTPPFPEHTSGHSVISSAAAVALTRLFGDSFAFTDSTEVEYGLTVRSFQSFKQAADEASISRLYGGIHYKPAITSGVEQGRLVGEFCLNRLRTRRNEKL